MTQRRHTVAELPQFIRDADPAGLTEAERRAMVDALSADPKQGDLVRNSDGVRKVRFAGRGKGKSGGFRVMTAYVGEHAPVYLLAILSKGHRGNFSASEVSAMRVVVTEIRKFHKDRTDVRRGRSSHHEGFERGAGACPR